MAFDLTVSEAKTEIKFLLTERVPESTAAVFIVEAPGLVYNQPNEFVYTSERISTIIPTCPSRSTGAYATRGALKVQPRTVRPTE